MIDASLLQLYRSSGHELQQCTVSRAHRVFAGRVEQKLIHIHHPHLYPMSWGCKVCLVWRCLDIYFFVISKTIWSILSSWTLRLFGHKRCIATLFL